MIITPALLVALMTSYKKEYQAGQTMAEPQWDQVASRVGSSSRSNTYGWLGQFPTFREWVGDRVIKDMQAHGYEITNKLFESTVGVARTDIEDDNIGAYAMLFQEMGRAAAIHPDELVFTLLAAGGSTLCYDGQNFFDTDHPVYPNVDGTGTPATVANQDIPATDPGAAWYLLDVSRAIKPIIYQERIPADLQQMTKNDDEHVFTADEYRYGVRARSNVGFGFWQMAYKSQQPLNAANYAAARTAMMNFKADGGRPMGVRPTLLVVPPTLEQSAFEVLKAGRDAAGATNVYQNTANLLVTPWLS
ncbi:Mu-like prophage major head subunit gpT family protein [Marinobacter salarius]|uniref:Mu-like prophage major head subunit gpT family protein n=1 Tax=Marinobacter salarius TaxID=1420917 RepID=UPI0025A46F97|nr:Mu-like prophage major head subunit gpT family protein [Marinobacter salarius]MDM8181261.1 Mu-like prophage major head subunit gpT family protein [Marinobacter salarius]